jgi:RNA polymerase sigma factor (sigma-70 family)
VATRQDRAVRLQLSTLFNIGVIRDLTDGQLLERYATGQGEAAELAFAALLERHGPMVLRVCRARLADPHDALDAFQATFLVLIEKSRGLWVRESLGPWLHQVATRTASCALSAAARRRRVERTASELAATEALDDGPCTGWEQALHEEIDRLPERYRIVIVLCDLEGHTCEEAARRIGRPVGTVKCWRARGRERLRQRLVRTGLAPSSAPGAALAIDIARTMVQAPAAAEAARALSECLTAGVVPASVQALVKGVFKAMILSKLKTAAVICALAFVATGLVTAGRVAAEDPQRPGDKAHAEPGRPVAGVQSLPRLASPAETFLVREPFVAAVASPVGEPRGEVWYLSIRDAVRIGLELSEVVRVLSVSGSNPTQPQKGSMDRLKDAVCVIQPVGADTNPQRFKAEVMALVRSIEQQYWSLSQQYIQLFWAERTVEFAEDLQKREENAQKAGRGTLADVAEASQRLEGFRLDLVTKSSDFITTERELRKLIGLPPDDNRRIVPVSVPVEAKVGPDWKECLAELLEKQPDVVHAKARLKAKEAERSGTPTVSQAVTRNFLLDLLSLGAAQSSVPTQRNSRESDIVRQIVHETTHNLARYFIEIDANYKQYETAKRLRATAAQRLDAQRAYYEEGRITIDRYLDAASQYAQAVAQEAQFKTTYNNSIVALEEAKGTLLEHDKITVVEHPGASKLDVTKESKPEADAKAALFVPPPTAMLMSSPEPPTPTAATVQAKPATPDAKGASRTISFNLTIDVGSRPVEIHGSFTIGPAGSINGGNR